MRATWLLASTLAALAVAELSSTITVSATDGVVGTNTIGGKAETTPKIVEDIILGMTGGMS